MTSLRCFLLGFMILIGRGSLAASSLLVAFHNATEGGIAQIEIGEDGIPYPPTILFHHPAFISAAKLRVSADGRHCSLNAETEGSINFALIDLATPETARLFTLDFTPEEHRFAAGRVYVGGTDGHLVAIDVSTGRISSRWDSRRQLSPPGHKPEDLLPLETEGVLIVSHQKDGKKDRRGSRLVVLRLEDLSLVADLPLPRDHPELHISSKDAGPSPEVLRIDRTTGTLLVTLDLYGALAFTDLKGVLAGRLTGYTDIPTSADDTWGVAFPDRLALATGGGRTLAIVSNASHNGGLAIFDVANRKRIAFYPVESGCESPVVIAEGRTLVTVVSGKRKQVTGGDLENITTPGSDLILLDLAAAAAARPDAMTRIPLGAPVSRMASIPGHPSLAAATLIAPSSLVIIDTETRNVISTTPIPGVPVSLQSSP